MSGQSPTVLQRSIAFKMIKLRRQAGMTQPEAAQAAGYSEATISHLENRRRQPHRRLVEALLRAYDAETEFSWFDEQLKLLKRKDWWDSLSGAKYPNGFDVYLGLEDGARKLGWWEPLILPGLLQSEGYARMMIEPNPFGVVGEALESRMQVRMQRQGILTRSNAPVNLWAITTEWALTNFDAPDAVKRDQLDYLMEMVRLPNVELQLIPNGRNSAIGSRGPFTIMDFDQPDDPGVVYVETECRAVWFEDHEDVDLYRHMMAHLHANAAGTKESAMLIEKHRKEVTR